MAEFSHLLFSYYIPIWFIFCTIIIIFELKYKEILGLISNFANTIRNILLITQHEKISIASHCHIFSGKCKC